MSSNISGVFIGKSGRYRTVQRGAVKVFGTSGPRPRICEAKIIFTFPILIFEEKNGERRDGLLISFLYFNCKLILYLFYILIMHVCIFMFCNMLFFYH